MEKLVPRLRFQGFEEDWEKVRLGDLSSLITKGTTPKNFVNNGIKFIKIEGFEDNYINPDKCLFIDERTHTKELKRSMLEDGDILFAIAGATIGKCNIVKKEFLPANTNQALAIIRLKSDQNRDSIYQILKSSVMMQYINDNIAGGAQPNLNLEQINNFSFYYSSQNEQTKIVGFFTEIDFRLNHLKKKKTLLEKYKKGMMQKIFNQENRFKDDDGKDFEDWEEKTLGEIAEIKRGAASQHLFYVDNEIDGVRLLRINDFLDNKPVYVRKTADIDRFTVSKNDLLIAGTGATAGIVFTVPDDFDGLPYSYNAPRIRVKHVANQVFVYNYLKSDRVLTQQKQLFVGNAQPFLDTDAIRSLKINLPSIKEQIKIGKFLSAVDDKINHVAMQIEKMEVWKKGLLGEMFV